MKVEENVNLCKLYDLYKNLLSKGQQEILSYYLYDDLTISEIAENLSVSRQSIKDSINKGKKKLLMIEDKISILQLKNGYESEIKKLKAQLSKIKEK